MLHLGLGLRYIKQTPMINRTFLPLLAGGLLLISCDADDAVIPNEEEVINEVVVTLTADNDTVEWSAFDVDGNGPVGIQMVVQRLLSNTLYTGSVTFANTLENEDITEEIEAEKEEHQLFFITESDQVALTYLDEDANGFPVGLNFELATGSTDTSSLRLVLRHEPIKTAGGVSDGILDSAGGTTDIEVVFPVRIQNGGVSVR